MYKYLNASLSQQNKQTQQTKESAKNQSKGFSLLETLVALSIFSIVFLGVAQFLSTNLAAKNLGSQLERVLRFSDSLLAQVQAVEDASIFANYNGNCTAGTNSNLASLSAWCYEFVEKSEYTDAKEVLLPALNVQTSYSKIVGTQHLKEFKLHIKWKQAPDDTKYQNLKRTIYLYRN